MKTLYCEIQFLEQIFFDDPVHYRLGMLKSWGADILRGVVGLRTQSTFGFDAQNISLSPETRREVVSFLKRNAIQRVIFAEIPPTGILETVLDIIPARDIAIIGNPYERPGELPTEITVLQPDLLSIIAEWLDVVPPPDYTQYDVDDIFRVDEPLYVRSQMNTTAGQVSYRPAAVVGSECSYFRSIEKNPYFTGVSMQGHPRGCTFCHALNEHRDLGDAIGMLVRRLTQIRRQLGPGRIEVPVIGAELLPRLDAAAEAIVQAGLNDFVLMFDPRVDLLLAFRERIVKALETLSATTNRLEFYLVGFENFSEDTLLRFNKGYKPLDNAEVIVMLRELKEQFPRHFVFDRLSCHGFITFNPWTTVDDLEINLTFMEHYHFEALRGDPWLTKLRLYPELPLAALAARDGLLLDKYDDPSFDTSARTGYGSELPYKFTDPFVEEIFRWTIRLLGPNPHEMMSRLLQNERLIQIGRSRFNIFKGIVACVKRLGTNLNAEHIETALNDYFQHQEPLSIGGDMTYPSRLLLPVDTEIALIGVGNRKVGKKEYVSPEAMQDLVGELWEQGYVVHSRMNDDNALVVLAARNQDDLQAAITAEQRMVTGDLDGTRAMGNLLGYPDCCVEAFMSSPHPGMDSLNLVRSLLETDTPPNSLLNSYSEVAFLPGFHPCRFDCPNALEWVDDIMRHLGESGHAGSLQQWREKLRQPLLVLLSEDRIAPIMDRPDGGYFFSLDASSRHHDLVHHRITRWEQNGDHLKLWAGDTLVRELVHEAFILEWDKPVDTHWLSIYYRQAVWNSQRNNNAIISSGGQEEIRYQLMTLVASLKPGLVPNRTRPDGWTWKRTIWQNTGPILVFERRNERVDIQFQLIRPPEPNIGALYNIRHRVVTRSETASATDDLMQDIRTYLKRRRLLA